LVATAAQGDEVAAVIARMLSYADRLFWISIGLAALLLTMMALVLAAL
jgi:hypothetical protein